MPRTNKFNCSCGGKHGRLHKSSCEHEECPFCHQQLMFCDCCYILLGVDSSKEPVHSQGLDEKQQKAWDKMLRHKGRVRVGDEVGCRAAENWTELKRKEAVAAVANEMSLAATKSAEFGAAHVIRWSERLKALASASSVFLEMNQNHILRGGPVEWAPPHR